MKTEASKIFILQTTLRSLQHLIFEIANAVAVPVVIGTCLGLNSAEIASLAQRTFLLVGIASLIQAVWGHRYPIVEGPAGMWYTTVIVLAGMATASGKSLALLRTDIETGLIAAGVLSIFLGVFGLMPYVRKLFTPVVNGTFLIVMSLQFSTVISKGFLITSANGDISFAPEKVTVFFITVGITLILSLKAKGFIQSIAILIGTTIGWVVAYVYGIAPSISTLPSSFFALPRILAWGTPTFDIGVTLTALASGMVVISNLVTSVSGMENLYGHPENSSTYRRTVICTGIDDILAALSSTIGFVPFASSIGFAALTGVLEMAPFIVGNIILVVLGLIPGVSNFFAAIPVTVGYAVLFSVLVIVLGSGIKECIKDGLGKKQMVILGLSIMVGNGINFIPAQAFATSGTLSYLFANGLIVSVLLSIFLDHVALKGD